MQNGLYFEDFGVGDTFSSPQRTITETDLVNFIATVGINDPTFTVKEYWERSFFGKRVIPAPMTFSVSQGLEQQLALRRGTGIAFMGVDKLRALKPVAVGDTIYVEAEVVHKRETRHLDRGVVTFKRTVKNQDGAAVMEWLQTHMILRENRDSGVNARLEVDNA